MPRINQRGSLRTSQRTDKDVNYDLNSQFSADHTDGLIYDYNAQDSLLLWSGFCEAAGPVIVGPGSTEYKKVANDRSLDGADLAVYAPETYANLIVNESTLSYIATFLPDEIQQYMSADALDMCGDPCFFLNLSIGSVVASDENQCTTNNIGTSSLLVQHNSVLNFANGGATEDKPFTISMWYYPLDAADNPMGSFYDKGGGTRFEAPTIFEKLFQYGLYMRECGKLEFVLYDTSVTVTSNTSLAQPVYTVNASSKTLTVRSSEDIIKPGEWNHICVTYDGSSTRAGMKIYVNCVDVTNPSDVPPSGSAKTFAITNGTGEQFGVGYLAWYFSLYTGADHEKENPADYAAMHSHNTPLLFSNQAMVTDITAFETGLTLSDLSLTSLGALPWSWIFDTAVWSTALTADEVIAVCAATRNCPVKYSTTTFLPQDSGYINLSPKIMQKIRDESKNSLSVIDRTGDRSDRMVASRLPFEDNATIRFGARLTDNFKEGSFKFASSNVSSKGKLYGILPAGILPDSSKWVTVGDAANVIPKIRRERRRSRLPGGLMSQITYDKALSFSSGPPGRNRTLESLDYFNNATIEYELILGPYQKEIGHLNLQEPPEEGAKFYIDIKAVSSSTWQNIRTHEIGPETSQTEFYSPGYSSGVVLNSLQHRYRRRFKINFYDINSNGEPYKIRFRTQDRCFGLGSVDIVSRDQKVRAPLLIDHDSEAGKKIDALAIATPHTRSDLIVTGSSLSSFAGSYLHFNDTSGQLLKPFKDNAFKSFAGRGFFDVGVDPNIAPGFDQPLKDKTHILVELNSATESPDFGITAKHTDIDIIEDRDLSGAGSYPTDTTTQPQQQPVNITWNDAAKEWQLSNQRISFVRDINFTTSGLDKHAHGQVFTTIDVLATASANAIPPSPDQIEHYTSEVISSYAQPTTAFGFPNDRRYFATSDPHAVAINMSKYISKPFLLEKVVVEFDARFEFAKTATAGAAWRAFRMQYTANDTSQNKPSRTVRDQGFLFVPSFTLTRIKGSTPARKPYSAERIITDGSTTERQVSIQATNSGCGELITYGQLVLYATASGLNVDIDKVLEEGMSRDAVFNLGSLDKGQPNFWAREPTVDLTGGLVPVTASFAIEAPIRNMPVIKENQRVFMKEISTPGNYYTISSGNPSGGRAPSLPRADEDAPGSINAGGYEITKFASQNLKSSHYSFNTSARGLVNNLSAVDAKNIVNFKISNQDSAGLPIDVQSSGHLNDNFSNTSPYLLFPGDRITLNFHYPIPKIGINAIPGSTDTTFNKMTLGKNTRIHMYGSLVKEGKEFHENMNQALTTNEVTEVIGNESVVDQFNIHDRSDYKNCYFDRVPFEVQSFNQSLVITLPVYVMLLSDPPRLAISGYYTSNASIDHTSLYSFRNRDSGLGWVATQTRDGELTGTPSKTGKIRPENRLLRPVGSAVDHVATFAVASASISQNYTSTTQSEAELQYVEHDFKGNYLNQTLQPISGTFSSKKVYESGTTANETFYLYRKTMTFPFVDLYNNAVRHSDGGINSGSLANIGSYSQSSANFGQTLQVTSRPQYIFRHDHFGHFADMLSAAKHTANTLIFSNIAETTADIHNSDGINISAAAARQRNTIIGEKVAEVMTAPVRSRFVTSSIATNGDVTYTQIQNADAQYSGNLTTRSTITSPFTDAV